MSSPHGAADYQSPNGSPRETDSKSLSRSSLREQLEKVLEQTTSQSANSSADCSALRNVAERHGHLSFGLTPVVTAMVEAMLDNSFRALAPSPEKWDSLVREIATVLHDDPIAYARLQQLWQQLVSSRNER